MPTNAPKSDARVPPRKEYFHVYEIKEKYDVAHDLTNVSISLHQRFGDIPVVGLSNYAYYGHTPIAPESVYMTFVRNSDPWRLRFLGATAITFQLDGKRRFSIAADQDSIETVAENVNTEMGVNDFLDLVNANTVDVTILAYLLRLTPGQIAALRDLASRMSP